MPKDSLGLLPPLGYDFKNRPSSTPALAWIAWKEREMGLKQVRTSRKGYEVQIANHWADGTGVDGNGTRHVLNFHG